MPTFQTIQADADNRDLIRKIRRAVGFFAPTTVDLPDTLFTGAGQLVDLKAAGWVPVGIVTPDGWEFARDVKKEDVSAFGYASSVRSDITEVPRTVKVTLLESGKRKLLELTYGTDLSAVTQNMTTGEVVFDEPDLPDGAEYRFLVVGSDGREELDRRPRLRLREARVHGLPEVGHKRPGPAGAHVRRVHRRGDRHAGPPLPRWHGRCGGRDGARLHPRRAVRRHQTAMRAVLREWRRASHSTH